MIIRKLAAGIRNRDWIEIVIELAIVVLGILIALQVNNWAGAKKDRQAERASLERLLEEFESSIVFYQSVLERQDRLTGLQRQGVAAAAGQIDIPEHDLPLRIGINTISFWPPINPPRTAYDEMTSSGRIQLIQNPDIRTGIADYYGALEELQARNARQNNDRFFDRYLQHVTYDYNPESKTPDVILSTYDWDSLRADKVFVSMLVGELRNQLNVQITIRDQHDTAMEICQVIAAELDTECENAAPAVSEPSAAE